MLYNNKGIVANSYWRQYNKDVSFYCEWLKRLERCAMVKMSLFIGLLLLFI